MHQAARQKCEGPGADQGEPYQLKHRSPVIGHALAACGRHPVSKPGQRGEREQVNEAEPPELANRVYPKAADGDNDHCDHPYPAEDAMRPAPAREHEDGHRKAQHRERREGVKLYCRCGIQEGLKCHDASPMPVMSGSGCPGRYRAGAAARARAHARPSNRLRG